MNLPIFSLKSILPAALHCKAARPPKVFRIFGGCATRPSAYRPGRAQTCSPAECFRVRLPENAQAALAKISIRSNNRQIHFDILNDGE